ncbi:TonB-dependent receptor [Chitinophaga sp. MM2321]|uniref:TonB-dependent receptor n=1 Tax=Chitinophaga sp. MM2321 TaxID=3137178 RepID=UPI0032D596DD
MKKTTLCGWSVHGGYRRIAKILLVMKLTLVLLTVAVLHVAAKGYSQSITYSGKNVPLQEVFSVIEKQTGFVFLYTESLLKEANPVSVKAENVKLDLFLAEIFKQQPLKYHIGIKSIFVSRKSAALLTNPVDLGISTEAFAAISGTVKAADGTVLPGATVRVKNTNKYTATDQYGKFSIDASVGDVLIISFIGYDSREISLNEETINRGINIKLSVADNSMNETVVIGYGTRKKSDLTGSVSSIKSTELTAYPTASVSHALQGRAAGVFVQQNSGAPGAPLQIRIRGTNSIQGSNEPLWIIDGFPGDQNMLNTSDIERIEILKDASATAIYGSRGANGVILITTKKGKAGLTRVDFNTSASFQQVRKKLDMMNAPEYIKLYNEFWQNTQGSDYFSPSDITAIGAGTDWQDEIFRQALVQDHSLNVSGGNEKTQFAVGTSYLNQPGIIENSDYSRTVLRGSVNHDISKKFSISYNAILGRTKDNSSADNQTLLLGALTAAPTVGPYKSDGQYRLLNQLYPFSPDDIINPRAYLNEVSRKQLANKVMANLAFTIKPIEDLSIRISGNITNNDFRSDNYISTRYPNSSGSASVSTGNSVYVNSDNIVTYSKTFKEDHAFVAMAGLTYENYSSRTLGASGSGFLSNVTETYNLGAANTFQTPGSSYMEWTLLSYLGRLNYTFKNKYLATVSFRADGSSRYSDGNKWGYFPSGALAWRFSEEKFMRGLSFVSDAKIRIGYGETGSTAIDPYYTLDMLVSGKAPFNDALYTYFAPGSRLPDKLKWETTAQTDIGLDLGLFNNQIRLSADYYVKNTRDLLNPIQLPRSVGYTNTVRNIGTIQNKGFEFQADANVFNGDLKWNIGATISFNRSKVVKLYDGQDIPGSTYNLVVANDYVNLLREGKSISAFYGYQADGFDASGHYKYKDLNKDGNISTADKAWIGDPNPNFIYGFNSNLGWKNFELSMFIQGTQGNDIFGFGMINQNYKYYQGYNGLREVLYDHWTPDHTTAKYPAIDKTISTRMSDMFVYDGSYLRLKTIRLAYNIPVGRLGINWIKKGQIYLSGENLITATKYPWWDPDVNSSGGSNSVNQGIDYYSYPMAKGYTLGARLSF